MPDSQSPCLISPGSARAFALAGLSVRYRNDLDSGVGLSLAQTYRLFEIDLPESSLARVEIRVSSAECLTPPSEALLKRAVHWSVYGSSQRAVFDFRHVPTSRVYCRATVEPSRGSCEVVFAEAVWREGGGALDAAGRTLPFPLEQLLLLPVFALEGGILMHAGGGLLGDGAFVYAGHSGDGKSTLSGLLADEGVALLSDERVVLRRRDDGPFVAYGTPWSGTGQVAACLEAPLSMALLLTKSDHHELSSPDRTLASELVSRAVVPYYFGDVAEEILRLFDALTRTVPIRTLRFARSPGVLPVLSGSESERESDGDPVRLSLTSSVVGS